MIRRALIVSSALLLVLGLAACNDSGSKPAGNAGAGGAAQQAAPVGVVTLKKDTYPITTILPGRAEAFQVADIRPQVNG